MFQPFPALPIAPYIQVIFLFIPVIEKEVFQVFHPLETRMDKGFDWNTS